MRHWNECMQVRENVTCEGVLFKHPVGCSRLQPAVNDPTTTNQKTKNSTLTFLMSTLQNKSPCSLRLLCDELKRHWQSLTYELHKCSFHCPWNSCDMHAVGGWERMTNTTHPHEREMRATNAHTWATKQFDAPKDLPAKHIGGRLASGAPFMICRVLLRGWPRNLQAKHRTERYN